MDAVQRVTDTSWVDQIAECQAKMAMETEGMQIDEHNVRNGIKAMIADPGLGEYFIITKNGSVAGTLMITKEWSDWRSRFFVWIQSVYVKPEFRNQGLYRKLYDHIKNMVEGSDEYAGIRLYVEKDNKNAQSVYQKLGMSSDHYHMYEWEAQH